MTKRNTFQLRYFRNFLREVPTRVTWLDEPYDTDSIMHYGTHQVVVNGVVFWYSLLGRTND